ncbi:hypothetical protein A1O1_08767 [Capronia coronata CBS 617.96]|uniref:Major facilitator superfamily (MFS) profile domain-containing protein n=1 Tax=Capronia coronata CBS 617.96 TaxID=1182541 RepID=W9XH10_9EURO|nr:uncharacterized protein A1O1_08767 [Capronia coronata CBS 617.96]EXJ79503.1 hypothetical protein A1O1_08767 [Capronia coronata CBS 617.96]
MASTITKDVVIEAAEPTTSRIRSMDIIEPLRDHADEALHFVEKHEGFTYTPEQDKAVLKKIDRHLMPLARSLSNTTSQLFVSYLFQYMDKSIMAQSLVYGLTEDLGLKGQEYSWCGSIFFFGYLSVQPFTGISMNRVPIGRFVTVISFCWAVVVFCTAGATNFSGLMAARFFLGMVEGGISPAYVLVTGMWYKKTEIPKRATLWFAANGLAIIIQAVISYGIGHINQTEIPTWKWFFIIFGLAGLILSAFLYFFMPDSPLTAKFLNEEEKLIAIERLRDNRTGVANREFKKHQLIEALKDPLVYYNFFLVILVVVPNSGVSFFGTLIIKNFGYDSFVSSLLMMPYGAVMCIGLPLAGYVSSKYADKRCISQFASAFPAIIGSALLFYVKSDNKAGRLAGFYLTGFSNAVLPLQFALMNSNTAGQTKRSITNAIMFLGYATGFIIGPQFFLSSEAPIYPTGFKTMLITFTLLTVAPVGLFVYLTWLNKQKQKHLIQAGGEHVYAHNEEFLDLTDKEQVHFRYSK